MLTAKLTRARSLHLRTCRFNCGSRGVFCLTADVPVVEADKISSINFIESEICKADIRVVLSKDLNVIRNYQNGKLHVKHPILKRINVKF